MARWIDRGLTVLQPRIPAFRQPVRVPVAVLAFATILLSGQSSLAQSPANVAEIVELRLKTRQQQARADVARWERNALSVNRPPANTTVNKDIGQLVNTAITSAYAKGLKSRPDTDSAALLASWRQAETRRLEFQLAVAAREAEYGFNWADRTPPTFRFTVVDLLIFVWAIIAFGISCGLAVHELRRPLRRNARARLPGGIAAAFALGLLSLAGCRVPDAAGSAPDQSGIEWERKTAEADLARATTEADELTDARNKKHAQLIDAWAVFLDEAPGKAGQERFREKDAELLGRVRAAAEKAALEDRLADDVVAVAGLDAEEAKLNEMTTSAVWRSLVHAAIRVTGVAIFALFAAAPYWIARRRVASERKASGRTCPRCLAVGKLTVQKNTGHDGEYTESTYLECKACEYRTARSYQYVPRLCFPTVGIRAGGKTHMLTTAYAAVQNRMVPTRAAVKTAPSVMDERFRQYVELVIRRHGETGGTVHDNQFLDPLLIQTQDTDKWGQNGVLVNLFDYSGELVEETPLAQSLRPRAMKMDGFMMIFDPTQIYGDVGGVTLEDQIHALAKFYEQMAEARGLTPGTLIPNPVAVCITKFDLLETHNPIGGMCLPFIQHLDGPLKPGEKQPVTLAMLKARSDLVEQMLPLMFPGVDLGRLVREYFGTQMLFFPMSSVNLNLDEFGRVDTSSRNPAPYGVVEPILWLMHMHGYCVLDAS